MSSIKRKLTRNADLEEGGPDPAVRGAGSDIAEEEDARGEEAGRGGGKEHRVARTQVLSVPVQ
jgi:hypothetical protein